MHLKEIYETLSKNSENQHYTKRYINFINNVMEQKISEFEYTENHHILPKSMFPQYSSLFQNPWNRCVLTARQHFIAHLILAKACGGSMWLAFHFMTYGHQSKLYVTKSYQYEELRRNASDFIRKNNTGKKHSEKTKEKISKSRKLWITKNPTFNDSVSHTHKGKVNVGGKMITKEEFYDGQYTHHAKGMVVAYDKITKKNVFIDTNTLKTNDRYNALTEDIVFARCIQSDEMLKISKNEFKNNKHLYYHKNCDSITVYDTVEKCYIRINKHDVSDRYIPAAKGKSQFIKKDLNEFKIFRLRPEEVTDNYVPCPFWFNQRTPLDKVKQIYDLYDMFWLFYDNKIGLHKMNKKIYQHNNKLTHLLTKTWMDEFKSGYNPRNDDILKKYLELNHTVNTTMR